MDQTNKTDDDNKEIMCDNNCEQDQEFSPRILKEKIQLIPTSSNGDNLSEWTLVYSDSNSSVFDDCNDSNEDKHCYYPLVDSNDDNDDNDEEKLEQNQEKDIKRHVRRCSSETSSSSIIVLNYDIEDEDHLRDNVEPAEGVDCHYEGIKPSSSSSEELINSDEEHYHDLCESQSSKSNKKVRRRKVQRNRHAGKHDLISVSSSSSPDQVMSSESAKANDQQDKATRSDKTILLPYPFYYGTELTSHMVYAQGQDENEDFVEVNSDDRLRPQTNNDSVSDSDEDDDQDDDKSMFHQYELSLLRNGDRIRAYFHKPNAVLNGKLNFILILSITAVLGLGIGHFIGWSNNPNSSNHQTPRSLNLVQIRKLKQLQEDLIDCMNEQSTDKSHSPTAQSYTDQYAESVCLNHADYWKERFITLFEENEGLKELFEKTQRHFAENRPSAILNEDECSNCTTISEEFQSLNLDLLVKQMEHLKLLEVLENEQKQQNHLLLMENEDLKRKLRKEEQDDEQMQLHFRNRMAHLRGINQQLRTAIYMDNEQDDKLIADLNYKIANLSQDNEQLKSWLQHLEKQILINDHQTRPSNIERIDQEESKRKYDLVRQQVNQLMTENEELKSKLARYRWTENSSNLHHQYDDKEQHLSSIIMMQKRHKRRQMDHLRLQMNILHKQLLMQHKKLYEDYQRVIYMNDNLSKQLKQLLKSVDTKSKQIKRCIMDSSTFDKQHLNFNDHNNNNNNDNSDNDKTIKNKKRKNKNNKKYKTKNMKEETSSTNANNNSNESSATSFREIWKTLFNKMSENYHNWYEEYGFPSFNLNKIINVDQTTGDYYWKNLDKATEKLYHYGKQFVDNLNGFQGNPQHNDGHVEDDIEAQNKAKTEDTINDLLRKSLEDLSHLLEKSILNTIHEMTFTFSYDDIPIDIPIPSESSTKETSKANKKAFRKNLKRLRKRIRNMNYAHNDQDEDYQDHLQLLKDLLKETNDDQQHNTAASDDEPQHESNSIDPHEKENMLNSWIMDRGLSREKARQIWQHSDAYVNDKLFEDWLIKRAKAREKRRAYNN